MDNDEVIDLTNMDKDEICHIKCHQRKELQAEIHEMGEKHVEYAYEIDKLEKENENLKVKLVGNEVYTKVIEAENKLLRECVEYYASRGSSLVNERAREVLNQLDEK